MLVLLLGLTMFITGYTVLIIASELKTQSVEAILQTSNSTQWKVNLAKIPDMGLSGIEHTTGFYDTINFTFHANESNVFNITQTPQYNGRSNFSRCSSYEESNGILPTSAILGIAAFACLDIGFDTSMTQVRTFLVDNVPSHQKSQVLASATIVSSVAAGLVSFTGSFDLPSVLGPAFDMDGVAATLIVICFCLLTMTCLAYLTSFSVFCNRNQEEKKVQSVFSNDFKRKDSTTDTFRRNCNKDKYTSSLQRYQMSPPTYGSCPNSESHQYYTCKQKTDVTNDHNECAYYNPTSLENTPQIENTESCYCLKQWAFILDKRLLLLLVAACFSFAGVLVMTVYISNTVTIEVLKGDPLAFPGSTGKAKYEEGLRVASKGLLLANCTFFGASLIINRLLDILGPKVLLIIANASLSASCGVYCWAQTVPTFYLAMAVYGPYRSVLYTATFLLATSLSNTKNSSAAGKRHGAAPKPRETNVAKVISLLGFLLTVNYLFLSSMMGPLMAYTNSAWPPVFYLMAFTAASILPMMALFFV